MATIRICGIYKITNTTNDKCYIGQSVNILKRYKQHFRNARAGSKKCAKFYDSLRKYGEANFEVDILCVCRREDLDTHERMAIKAYNSIASGYNLTDGGNKDTTVSVETRIKIGNASRGRVHSEDSRNKIKEALRMARENGHTAWNKGKKLTGTALEAIVARNKSRAGLVGWKKGIPTSEETKRKLSKAHTGKKLSEETKQKLSIAMKAREITWGAKISASTIGKKLSQEVRAKISSTLLGGLRIHCSNGKIYQSVTEAAQETRSSRPNISAVLSGRRKTTNSLSFWKGE